MIDPDDVPTVADGETLARYVLQRSHFRSSDQSIKPDAFMPPPDLELSVTRHLLTTNDELWSIGEDVALQTSKTLYGRGDIETLICRQLDLDTLPAPLPTNANHAHVVGWPIDKSAKKNVAQEIAARARYVPKPSL